MISSRRKDRRVRRDTRRGRRRTAPQTGRADARIESLAAAHPDMLFALNRRGRITFVPGRPHPEHLLPPTLARGRSVIDLVGQENGRRIMDAIECTLRQGTVTTTVYRLEMASGSRWYEARIAPLSADEVTAVVRCINAEREREEMLQAQRAQLSTLLHAASALLHECAPDTLRRQFPGDTLRKALGSLPSDVCTAAGWRARVSQADRDAYDLAIASLRKGKDVRAEYRFLHGDGHHVWLREDLRHIPAADSSSERVVGTVVDITSRRSQEIKLERTLQLQERVAAVSRAWLESSRSDAQRELQAMLGCAGQLTGAERAYVFTREGPIFHNTHE